MLLCFRRINIRKSVQVQFKEVIGNFSIFFSNHPKTSYGKLIPGPLEKLDRLSECTLPVRCYTGESRTALPVTPHFLFMDTLVPPIVQKHKIQVVSRIAPRVACDWLSTRGPELYVRHEMTTHSKGALLISG